MKRKERIERRNQWKGLTLLSCV